MQSPNGSISHGDFSVSGGLEELEDRQSRPRKRARLVSQDTGPRTSAAAVPDLYRAPTDPPPEDPEMQFHSETEEEDGCHHMRSLALLAEARAYLFAEVAGLGLLRDRAASEAWETDDVEQGSEIEVSGDPEEQETACLDFHQDLERDFDERAHSEPQSDLVLAPDPGPENLERPLIDLSDEPLQADPGIFNEHEDERVQYPWIYGQSFPNQPFVPQQRYSTQQPPIFSLDSPEDDPNPFDQAAVEQARTEELQNLASRLSESQRENETLRRQISELESKIAGLEALNGAKERSRKRKLEASFKGLDALKEIGKETIKQLLNGISAINEIQGELEGLDGGEIVEIGDDDEEQS